MTNPITTRRQFIKISAFLGGASLAPSPVLASLANTGKPAHWRGIALGAFAEIRLMADDLRWAEHCLKQAVLEINRLENIFSLYKDRSSLCRLNRSGNLKPPPPEMVQLLGEVIYISETTKGAFDPSMQPLWKLYQNHFADNPSCLNGPSHIRISEVLKYIDFPGINFDDDFISLNNPFMNLSLNGIAQGYITDRIVNLLRHWGFENFSTNLGEPRLVGRHPEGRPWRVGLRSPDDLGAYSKRLDIIDRAIATSAPRGTFFDKQGKFHHLLDPRTGFPASFHRAIAVNAPNATLADGLSTAFSVMPVSEIINTLTKLPNIEIYRQDQQWRWSKLSSRDKSGILK